MKIVNIDSLLEDKAVTIVIGGVDYVVKDIPLNEKKPNEADEVGLRKFVSNLVGCPEEVLAPYGLAGLTLISKVVHENLLESLPSVEAK